MIIIVPERESSLSTARPAADAYGLDLRPVTREWHSGKDRCLSLEQLEAYLDQEKILAPWEEA